MPSSVPVIDLTPWFGPHASGGDEAARAAVAAEVDAALQSVGFFLISGHGVPDDLRARVRAQARAFFALPAGTKQRYAVTVGGRGWLPPGVEANGYAEGTQTPPDLKESFAVGADQPTGDPEVDGYWFQPNVYPAEVPGLEPAIVGYLARMRALADELLVLCAAALGLEPDFFTRYTGHATHTMNVNWYPPMAVAGTPEPGQFRIGPHTDFGTVTILDREPGRGGLQVWTDGRRLGGRALRARRLHHQHRRPAGPVERRPVEVQPAPGAAAAGRGAGRGPRLAGLLLRGRPRRGDRVAAAADRQAPTTTCRWCRRSS